MRVVLDTNVILSAFLWQKGLRPVYTAVKSGTITPCFNQETWNELDRTLNYARLKKQLSKIGVDPNNTLKLIASRSYFTLLKRHTAVIQEDYSDNYILACALSARAFCIVSGDKHLLNLKIFQSIPIMKPKKFIKEFHLR